MSFRTSLPRPRVAASLIGAAIAALLLVQVAFAHATPTKLSPADGAVLNAAPTEVSIDTGSAMADRPTGNNIVVRDASGAAVTATNATVDANRTHMHLALPGGLKTGVYTAQWSTVSGDDGEPASGSWTFTYDPTKAVTAGTQPAAPSSSGAAASLRLTSPVEGATVTGSSLSLALQTTNVTLVPMDTPAPASVTGVAGHLHVMVDGRQLGMVETTSGLTITNLENGAHTVMVELVSTSHASFAPPIITSARLTVTGSSATGPARLQVGATPTATTAAGGTAVTPTAPKTGSGGILDSGRTTSVVALALGALAVAIVGRRLLASRGSR